MKVLIIEDEPITARELKYVLGKLDSNIEIMATVDSIETALEFLEVEQDLNLRPLAPRQVRYQAALHP